MGGYFIGVEGTEDVLVFVVVGIIEFVVGGLEMDMRLVSFGGGWVGGLEQVLFPLGFGFILLFVVFEVGGEGGGDFS